MRTRDLIDFRLKSWPEIRLYILDRDGYVCQECGEYGDEADHIWPRSLGGPDLVSNLRCLCRTCNARKGNSSHLMTLDDLLCAIFHLNVQRDDISLRIRRLTAQRAALEEQWAPPAPLLVPEPAA